MTQISRRTLLRGSAATALFSTFGPAFADIYPSRPVRLVIPNSAGSSVDILARRVGTLLGASLGQSFYIENLPGAGGIIGTQNLIRSVPDGYSLSIVASNHVVIPHVNPKSVRYDALKQVTPIALILEGPLVLAARKGFPAANAGELIAYCKANPGKVTFGTSGLGTTVDLAGRALQQVGQINVVNVPYRGVASLVPDVLSGQVDVAVFGVSAISQQILTGDVRGLGVTTNKRVATLPDVPAIADSVPDFKDFPAWYAFLGPAGLPAPITNRLAQEIAKIQADPAFIDAVSKEGDSPRVMGPDELGRFMASESARIGQLVKDAKLAVE